VDGDRQAGQRLDLTLGQAYEEQLGAEAASVKLERLIRRGQHDLGGRGEYQAGNRNDQ
jgi:hypothetical protein